MVIALAMITATIVFWNASDSTSRRAERCQAGSRARVGSVIAGPDPTQTKTASGTASASCWRYRARNSPEPVNRAVRGAGKRDLGQPPAVADGGCGRHRPPSARGSSDGRRRPGPSSIGGSSVRVWASATENGPDRSRRSAVRCPPVAQGRPQVAGQRADVGPGRALDDHVEIDDPDAVDRRLPAFAHLEAADPHGTRGQCHLLARPGPGRTRAPRRP